MKNFDSILKATSDYGIDAGFAERYKVDFNGKTYYMFSDAVITYLDTDPHDDIFTEEPEEPSDGMKYMLELMNKADAQTEFSLPKKGKAHTRVEIKIKTGLAFADLTYLRRAVEFTGSGKIFYDSDKSWIQDTDDCYKGVFKIVSEDESRMVFLLPVVLIKER